MLTIKQKENLSWKCVQVNHWMSLILWVKQSCANCFRKTFFEIWEVSLIHNLLIVRKLKQSWRLFSNCDWSRYSPDLTYVKLQLSCDFLLTFNLCISDFFYKDILRKTSQGQCFPLLIINSTARSYQFPPIPSPTVNVISVVHLQIKSQVERFFFFFCYLAFTSGSCKTPGVMHVELNPMWLIGTSKPIYCSYCEINYPKKNQNTFFAKMFQKQLEV